MKWMYSLRKPYKAALILTGVMLSVILFDLAQRKIVTEMNRSMVSIHNDRLVPASDLFHMTEMLYHKRLAMENYLSAEAKPGTATALTALDARVAERLEHYEKTYLVKDEKALLAQLKTQLSALQVHDRLVVSLHQQSAGIIAKQQYTELAIPVWRDAINSLSALHDLQTRVGKDLLKNTANIYSFSEILFYTTTVLAIVLGIMVIALVGQSQLVRSTQTNYTMN